MKLNDIRDHTLREWSHRRIEECLAERKAAKRFPEGLRDIWRTYTEGDWGALRELCALRTSAHMREIERDTIELAIQRRLAALQPVEFNGASYGAPYSMGVEVAVLRDLLGVEAPPRATVTQIDFHS